MVVRDKKVQRTVLSVLVVAVLWIVGGRYMNRSYKKEVLNRKKMYCYQEYWGTVNPVLFVKKKQLIDSLVEYYQGIEKGNPNPVFNFPPLSLPYDTCVYILGYEIDSSVAHVICYDDWGKQGSFVKGYVYIHTLHDSPPPKEEK
ncbi:hypothetical protein [Prolixibacter denitrificans]|uniref:Uncharacterized protein n=1 Tax=Prolixibacter denitrificans TaxID=1541063 RepID=A0A2P8C7M1_9BACT|nr:hypothetical protein [Prolixibacter denitrificans]PSK80964.1 hypothetical protein CLV93_11299 [Prolixibacter denitrificans]GET22364.1 hypothetical protein JCM18694_26100 [Prolixibacter denitrificans]